MTSAPVEDGSAPTLLGVAGASIEHGLAYGGPLRLSLGDYPEPLRAPGACFVTLRRQGALRGCIGSLEPRRPLVVDVAENAHAAAFGDPRFPPLARHERIDLEIHLSVLTPLEPLPAASEAELLAALRPGVDGLVLREGERRATFLPAVWGELPDPRSFLGHLRRKAGLGEDHWSPTLRFWRYRVEDLA
jgi:uncharacterized protein